jgi:hypothetical protein
LKEIENFFFLNCTLKSICIPHWLEGLSKSCFEKARIPNLVFEHESSLRLIGPFCFAYASLGSVCIPRSVEILYQSCFEGVFCGDIMFESGLVLRRMEVDCFYGCTLTLLRFSLSLEVVSPSLLKNARIETVEFAPESSLKRIEEESFAECLLREVDFIDATALCSSIEFFSVDPANRQFAVHDGVLIDLTESKAVRYFGDCEVVVVHKEVEILGPRQFC